ncbi:alpha/beta fold hydrolase [Mycolicibacterium aubagnense]|nr:alpha/beta hydrolase [Mycolicibacterium aubagnense]
MLSVSGIGTPVVLLHGYADSADTWRRVLMHMDALGRNAIAVDLPGFGQAEPRRSGPMVPQFDAFVDAVLAEIGPAILVGNSLGAATAVRAAARRGAPVQSVVALDYPLAAQHWPARLARSLDIPAWFWSGLGHVPIPSPVVRSATRWLAPHLLYGPGMRPDPEVMKHWSRTVSRISDVANLARYGFQYAYESAEGHRGMRIACPLVIVHGAKDRIIPVHSSCILHQEIPGSDLLILPCSGHCPQLDNPAEVVRIIVQLLEQIENLRGRARC